MAAPYPDLHPELWEIVRGLDAAFPEPQESLPVGVFRDRLEELAAKAPMIPPDGLETLDWVMEVAKRPVRLRAYLPEGAGSDAMLYMHGGGWMLGSIEGHDQVCADLAAETGLRVVSIDYALSPEHRYPVALEECLAALTALCGGPRPLGRCVISGRAGTAPGETLHWPRHSVRETIGWHQSPVSFSYIPARIRIAAFRLMPTMPTHHS